MLAALLLIGSLAPLLAMVVALLAAAWLRDAGRLEAPATRGAAARRPEGSERRRGAVPR